jgi:5-oxoprolinase (ATP-hydrolysing)
MGNTLSRFTQPILGSQTRRTLEKRYPCILHEFSIRKGSGGDDHRKGGDGCVRDIEFRVPVDVSILSERRTVAPYGMHGGSSGTLGENVWIKRDAETGLERETSLGGKNSCRMGKGDHIVICEFPSFCLWR